MADAGYDEADDAAGGDGAGEDVSCEDDVGERLVFSVWCVREVARHG